MSGGIIKWIMPIVLLIASIFTIIAYVAIPAHNNILLTNAKKVEAEAYKKDPWDKDSFVKYKVDGIEYESAQKVLVDRSEGLSKKITIIYDKKDPNKICVNYEGYVKGVACLIVCTLILIITIIGLIIIMKKEYRRIHIKELGVQIEAVYINSEENYRYKIGAHYPFVINCRGINPQDGKEYTFTSSLIFFDPTGIIENQKIEKFPVYIDPKDPKNYLVDCKQVTDYFYKNDKHYDDYLKEYANEIMDRNKE